MTKTDIVEGIQANTCLSKKESAERIVFSPD